MTKYVLVISGCYKHKIPPSILGQTSKRLLTDTLLKSILKIATYWVHLERNNLDLNTEFYNYPDKDFICRSSMTGQKFSDWDYKQST